MKIWPLPLLFFILTASCAQSAAVTDGEAASGGASAAGNGDGSGDGSGNGSGNGQGGQGTGPDGKPLVLPPATGIAIDQLAVYQTIKSTLIEGSQVKGEPAVPIVAGKDAVFRIFFRLLPEWQSREIIIRLELFDGTTPLPTQELRGAPAASSSEDSFGSTASFLVPAAQMTPTLAYRVSIVESSPDARFAGNADLSVYPTSGGAPAFVKDPGPIKMVIVPIQYNADGSGRLPDTSPERLEAYRRGMLQLYPTRDVQMTVSPSTLAWSQKAANTGQGWDSLLNGVMSRRIADKPASDVYYYGLFVPAESIISYCAAGCVAGLSALAKSPTTSQMRTSIGLGFVDDQSVYSMVHEVGHAHGREHAPCGLLGQPSDPSYPHANADLGVWGFDMGTKALISPSSRKDVMSYCEPRWVSDYTYKALYTRIATLNNAFDRVNKPVKMRIAALGVGGRLRWLDTVEVAMLPDDESRRDVTLFDDKGKPTGKVSGYYFPYSHVGGGLLMVPATTPLAPRLRDPDLGDLSIDAPEP